MPVKVSAFEGGDGTEETPYRIGDCEQLQAINDDLDAYYVLANDIDCAEATSDGGALWNSGAGFDPIGDYGEPFLGELDGDGRIISNLFQNTTVSSAGSGGLFNRIGQWDNQTGLVKQLGIENVDITGEWSTGGIVGVLYGQLNNVYAIGEVSGSGEVGGLVGSHGGVWDTVIDSWADVDVTGTGDVVGGLVGYNADDSNIINSFATGDVVGGDDHVGGLVGLNDGNIENAHATGTVSANDSSVGGLVGRNNGGSVTNSYAMGNVTGNNYIGGLVGNSSGSAWSEPDTAIIQESYATGNVTLTGDGAGGLVGFINGGLVSDVYARGNVTANNRIGGLIGEANGAIKVQYGYATGSLDVTGVDSSFTHGFIGDTIDVDGASQFYTSFFDQQTNGGITTDDDNGSLTTAYPKNTNQMTTVSNQATFTTNPNPSPEPGEELNVFDFENIWTYISSQNANYPLLQDSGATEVPLPDTGDDSENTVSFVSPLTGKGIMLELSEECEFEVTFNEEKNLATSDPAYDYPNGLVGFNADCGAPGFTATVSQYYFGVESGGSMVRKYNANTSSFFMLDDAVIEQVDMEDGQATKVTYTVTDGGERDSDGLVDGNITDPAGLATNVVGSPDTGIRRLKF